MPYATVNGHRIHYIDTQKSGQPTQNDKIPIVMIHGLGSSENYYMPIIPALAGHRCVALSSYGTALSKSQGEKVSLAELGEDVIGLMDVLQINKAVVAGHSMGGTMVCYIAASHPDRVAGLVGIGPTNPASIDPKAFQSRIDAVTKDGMEAMADSIPSAATGSRSTALQRAMIRELLSGQDPKSYASHCQAIMEMKDPGFEKIKCPALIIAGDEDKSAPLEGCRYILDHLGSSSKDIKILEGVGHWHCIEASDQVGEEIAAFASKL